MRRYVYEMVTLYPWDENELRSFYVAYHFEDYFMSRKAAEKFLDDYIVWMLREKLAEEAVQVGWTSPSGAMLAKWRTFDGKKTEYYGIVRNMILG